LSGLALPTAAAAALTLGTTGAAMATGAPQFPHSKNATSSSQAQGTAAALSDARSQAILENARARVNAAATVARSAQRKDLAARQQAAQRAEQAHAWQLPLKNAVRTSNFGWRWGRLHAGEDFAAAVGTNLVSMSTGTVTFAGEESGYGTMVKIRYWDGTTTFYAHMSRTSVTPGEVLEPGEVVGLSGNSGHSTGPHLHLEIHPDGGEAVDPAIWLARHKIDY